LATEPTPTPTKPGGRLDSLTSLRWFAAFLVFGVHALAAGILHRVPGVTLAGTTAAAACGVCFFFVLSGFVLTWTYNPSRTNAHFWQDRFARIGPLHISTWLAATFITAPAIFKFANVRTLLGAPSLVALVFGQAWIPKQRWYFAGNLVAWSLSCEAFFYLCFPLLVRLIMRARNPWTIAGVATAAAFAVAAVGAPMSHSFGEWWGYYFPLARLPEFVLGIALCRLVREQRWPHLSLGAVLAVATFAVFADRWLPWTLLYAAGPLIPLAALVATAASFDRDGVKTWLHNRWLILLGEISYAFYLVHVMVIIEGVRLVKWRPGSRIRDTAFALALVAASIVVSWIVHQLIELPAQRLLRSRGRGRSTAEGVR
jgi:peptidoglycan/LPS O-acetylase OafA/YrhL